MLNILKLLCYKISIPAWIVISIVLPLTLYAGYLKYENVCEENENLALHNEIKTLKFLNAEHESSIEKLKISIDVNAIQIHDMNYKLSQCYRNLTKLQTGYNEIEAIMNSDSSCECTDNDENAGNAIADISAKPTSAKSEKSEKSEKSVKSGNVSSNVNKNGIVFINKQLNEISK